MAIQDTDLLVVHRPGTSDLYKLAVGDLPIPDDVDVDLGYTPAVDKGTVTNSAGDDAEIPLAGVNAGLMDPDQVTKLLGIEEGAQVNIPAVTALDTPPADPSDGDLWYNTSDGRLYIYYNDGSTSQWVDASPIGSSGSDFSGDYNDLTNKPAIGDGTITIYESDGVTEVGNFTVNQTGTTDINLPVIANPTDFVKLDDEGTEQAITGGGGLSIDGNLGVGTTNPRVKLEANGTILSTPILFGANQERPYLIAGTPGYTGANTNFNTFGIQHSAKIDSNGVSRVTIDTHNGEAFCVNNDRKVGIGVTDPTAQLEVAGITNVDALQTTERTITASTFDLSTGNHWTCGAITVPNPSNCVAATSGLIRITAGPVVWSNHFKFPGGSAPTITSFPAIIPFYVQSNIVILMGNVSEGIS